MANPTQENLEAITAMNDAGASSIDVQTQAELVEQRIVRASGAPLEVRRANGELVRLRETEDLLALQKYLDARIAASRPAFGLRFAQCVPPGGGGTP